MNDIVLILPSACCSTFHIALNSCNSLMTNLWHFMPFLWTMRCVVTGSRLPWMQQRWERFTALWHLHSSRDTSCTKGFSGRCGCKLHTITHTLRGMLWQMWGEQEMPSHHWVATGNHLLHTLTLYFKWSFSSDSFTLSLPLSSALALCHTFLRSFSCRFPNKNLCV